jgi:Flp pilus assembly protein TadG
MDLFRCSRGTAAVEAAIFAPIFLLFTLGIADLGSAMFIRMSANAATQAGAIYAIVTTGSACSSVTAASPSVSAGCLSGIKQAMNDARADPSFCTGTVCTATAQACTDASSTPPATCISVTASYSYTPILSSAIYSWATDQTAQYTATVRIK